MIVVIADDISGAAELAGVALRHGLSAEVQTAFDAQTDADVVCFDTDSRSLAPHAAAAVVTKATKRVAAARPAWIYKKCDSVLRGSVRVETQAMMDVLGKRKVLLVPANPSRRRVIRGGCYFVDNQPLAETVFSRDPDHPRLTSRVADLLGGSPGSIVVPDAQNVAEVAAHAAAVDDDTLPVGGADFFDALLQLRDRSGPTRAEAAPVHTARGTTLLICGSAASWPERRDEAETQGLPVFKMPYDVGEVNVALAQTGRALIGIGDGPSTLGRTPAELAHTLADAVASILRTVDVESLLLEGGATAAAIVRTLGWSRLRVCEGSASGVGVLAPLGATRTHVFIKPGSYAWPSEIWPGM